MAKNIPKALQIGLVMALDSAGKDWSGNGNNGSLVNSPTKVRVLQNDGLSYDGSTQYTYSYSTTPSLNGLTEYTASCWIKFTTTTFGTMMGVGAEQSVFGYLGSLFANLTSGKLSWGITQNSGGANIITTNNTYNDGKYHLVTATRLGSSHKIYIDGVIEVSGTLTSQSVTYAGYSVGTRFVPSTPIQLFLGSIINPMIWNRELSAQEVQILHKAIFIK